MEKLLFIEYPKCSTCQKAKKWLTENKQSFNERDIINQTPTAKELKSWREKFDFPLSKLWNTSGIKYRELKLKEKLQNMSEEEQLELLASDGMLLKRPILVGSDFMTTGFREKQWIELLKIGE